MTWAIGGTYRFVADLGAIGLTVTWTSGRINGAAAPSNPTVTDLSDGSYDFAYVIATAGPHSWRGAASNGAVVTVNFTAVTAAQADPVTAVGLTSDRVANLDHLDAAVSDVLTAAEVDILAQPVADYARDTLGGRVALLGAGASVVTSPVSADGETMTLTQGDDYTVASGQPIVHTEPVGGPSWPTLTDATPRLVITNRVNASVIDDTGTVVTATGTGKSVRFELTAAQTGGLHVGDPAYYFAVVVTLADASERTLVRGAVAVERDARP